jgi:hypothetical protein
LLAAVRSPATAELACAALSLPPFRAIARQVFFGRGSFPDADPSPARGANAYQQHDALFRPSVVNSGSPGHAEWLP